MFKNYIKIQIHILLCLTVPTLMKANAKAQLDLPPIPIPSPQPQIIYNGIPVTTPAQALADRNRDQRFGPPYTEDLSNDDGSDDFRVSKKKFPFFFVYEFYKLLFQNGQTYDERMRYGFRNQPYRQFNSSFGSDSPFSDKNLYNGQVNFNNDNVYDNHNRQQLNQNTYNDRYGNNYNQPQQPQQQPPRINNNLYDYPNNVLNEGTPTPPPNNFFPTTTFNPNNPDTNRFQNPYNGNQDRFNLNQRYGDRQRDQQDRRYQIELEKLRNLLVETDQKGSLECTANVAAQWNFETNVNEFTQTEAVSNYMIIMIAIIMTVND